MLVVKDGTSKISSPYAFDFGLATAGTTKTFTLSNPGTEDLDIAVSETGDFGATLSATTIAAGGDVTLTVAMPEATGSSAVTITPDAEGIDPFVINVSGTIRDANKLYEYGFTALPTDWTTTGSWYYSETNGAYTTSWYLSSNARLITPQLTISEGETFFVETKGYSTSNTSYQHLQMQYSADGSTWTNFGDEPTLDPSNWTTFAITGAPAGKYYIAINASQADIRMFYGGQLPTEPKMVVTQPASLDYGVITEATAKTFTIANTGKATLEGISVTSSNSSVFTLTGAPTSLAAGASAEVTITMSASTFGALSSDITVSATDMEDVVFTVTGVVLPDDMFVVDFNDNTLPDGWGNNASNKWSFSEGKAYATSAAELTTPRLQFTEGDLLAIKITSYDNYDNNYLEITGSVDGSTWTAFETKRFVSRSQIPYGSYATLVINDIPTNVKYLKFKGYYVRIDEIAGLTYAPVLSVTKDAAAVSTPANYDFGECAADAAVTYSFANTGAGTINITNVAITGDGAAAYTTNWTENVAVPFDLVITRSYDAGREGASDAVVTVTTTEGTFVINVTGTDKAANAPELAVTLGGETVTTGLVADFGTNLQVAPAVKTFTLTNSGTGTLAGTIATSDDTQFTVSKTSFSLGAAESTTFDLALVYDENYGAKAATITIHPTIDGLDDVVINATASTLDPASWIEDFSDGTLPMGWVASTWTVGTFSNYENKTAMALAPSSSTAGTLITPCLTAKKNEVLTWDAYLNWYDEALIVEYSDDNQETWNQIYNCKTQDDEDAPSTSTRYYHKAMSFTAPADGNYYLRFTSTYQNGVDNFCGFKLNLPEHIMSITASNIPSSSAYYMTMKEGVSFNATVTLAESRGVDEEITAKFYMGDEVIGTASETVEANSTKVVTIVCTPTTSATEGVQMHIEVEWAGTTLTTEAVTRYVDAVTRLTLVEDVDTEIETGTTYDIITLTRNFAKGWNTFISPISVNMSEFGEDAKAYTFSGYEDGVLRFSSVTTLNPATPYIIYIPEAMNDKVFTWNNASISSMFVGAANIRTTQNGVILQGTYAPIAAGEWTKANEDDLIYGVTDEAQIAKAGDTASIKGFRAYFDVPSGEELSVKELSFDGITTGLGILGNANADNIRIFDLMGRQLNKVRRGMNIVNGKKVMVK